MNNFKIAECLVHMYIFNPNLKVFNNGAIYIGRWSKG